MRASVLETFLRITDFYSQNHEKQVPKFSTVNNIESIENFSKQLGTFV